MADEFHDDEYHFAGESEESKFTDEEISSAVVSTTSGVTQLKRIVLIALAGFVVLLAGYKFLGGFFSSSSDKPTQVAKAPAPKPAVQTPVVVSAPTTPTTPTVTPQVTSTPVVTTAPQAVPTDAMTSATGNKILNQMSTLEQASSNARSDINSINSNVTDLKENASELVEEMSEMTKSISQLTQQIKSQQTELLALKKQLTPKKKPKKKVVKPKMKYYVRALIPGRAWLVSERGTTITVSEGINIQGYGQISGIFPMKGIVTTTSGLTIGYNPKEL